MCQQRGASGVDQKQSSGRTDDAPAGDPQKMVAIRAALQTSGTRSARSPLLSRPARAPTAADHAQGPVSLPGAAGCDYRVRRVFCWDGSHGNCTVQPTGPVGRASDPCAPHSTAVQPPPRPTRIGFWPQGLRTAFRFFSARKTDRYESSRTAEATQVRRRPRSSQRACSTRREEAVR